MPARYPGLSGHTAAGNHYHLLSTCLAAASRGGAPSLPGNRYRLHSVGDEILTGKIIKKHKQLVHSDMLKVTSHVQRNEADWILNTIMVEGYDVPFRYKRKQ